MAKAETRRRARIIKAFREVGFHVDSNPASATTGAGRSDLTVCARGRYIAVEVKEPGEKPTKAQIRHLEAVERAGGWAYVADDPKQAVLDITERLVMTIPGLDFSMLSNPRPVAEEEAPATDYHPAPAADPTPAVTDPRDESERAFDQAYYPEPASPSPMPLPGSGLLEMALSQMFTLSNVVHNLDQTLQRLMVQLGQTPLTAEAPKRRRRTKAEIEAEKQAAAE